MGANLRTEKRLVMFKFNKTIFLLVVTALSGCSSIVAGKHQNIHVSTECNGEPIAMYCTLTNENGSWSVNAPGFTTVQRAYGLLTIKCSNGSVASVNSSVRPAAFGNLLFFTAAGTGALVDNYTGAAYEYPEKIKVAIPACQAPMQVNRWWR
jgi:hypothetical protein